jgi:hypothetical protein
MISAFNFSLLAVAGSLLAGSQFVANLQQRVASDEPPRQSSSHSDISRRL